MSGRPIISLGEIRFLFESVSDLLGLNSQLLKELLGKAASDRIGKIFSEFAPYFKMYVSYLCNVEEVMQRCYDLMQENKSFCALCRDSKIIQRLGGYIQSILISPVQ